MLVMINNNKATTRKEVKHESARIERIVLDLQGIIVNSLFSSSWHCIDVGRRNSVFVTSGN